MKRIYFSLASVIVATFAIGSKARAADISTVQAWFAAAEGTYNMQSTNGTNCNGIVVIDQGEIVLQLPSQPPLYPNGLDVQLSFFDGPSNMVLNGNTYTAQFTVGIEGGSDKHQTVQVIKGSDGKLQSISALVTTGHLFDKKTVIDAQCSVAASK